MWFRGPRTDVIELKMSLSPVESWPLCLPAALVNELAAKWAAELGPAAALDNTFVWSREGDPSA